MRGTVAEVRLQEAWRYPWTETGRSRALDGVRGVGVTAIVVGHSNPSFLPGGGLAVDLFFVFSGYIITRQILQGRYGDPLSPPVFWAARVRRLLPPFVLVVLATILLVRWLGAAELWPQWQGDLWAALRYLHNWHLLSGDASYYEIINAGSPTVHLWSLSAEEQFYLLWPLLLLIPFVRRRIGVFLVVLASVAVVWSLGLAYMGADADRILRGTDARVIQLSLGALIAVGHLRFRAAQKDGTSPVMPWWARLLWPANLVLLAFVLLPPARSAAWAVVTTVAIGLAAALVGAGVLLRPERLQSRLLSWRPLAALGVISYSVYLWHMPVLWAWLQFERSGAVPTSGVLRALVAWSAAVLLAIVSWLVLEGPLLLVDLRRKVVVVVCLVAGVAALVATAAVVWVGLRPPPDVAARLAIAAAWDCPEGSPVCEVVQTAQADAWECEPSVGGCVVYSPPGRPTATVMVTGDSFARSAMPGLVDVARERQWRLLGLLKQCGVSASAGWFYAGYDRTPVYDGKDFRLFGNTGDCIDFPARLSNAIAVSQPDVVVALSGAAFDAITSKSVSEPVAFFDPRFAEVQQAAIEDAVAPATAAGVPVVILQPADISWASRCTSASGGPPVLNSAPPGCSVDDFVRVHVRTQALRDAISAVAQRSRLVWSVDAQPLLCRLGPPCPPVADGVEWRTDGLHLEMAAQERFSNLVVPAIEQALESRP